MPEAGGRKDVEKSETIVFLVTDGKPNNAEATALQAAAVRAAGRLVVVPVGSGMGSAGLEAMMSAGAASGDCVKRPRMRGAEMHVVRFCVQTVRSV